jgi:pimeloyl-ACP methyl ester carboxylesterase
MTASPAVVFVHGAGDTAAVWRNVQRQLEFRSLAIDLLGRGRNPFDLSRVTLELAVGQAIADIERWASGPIVVVSHSIGGALSPGIIRHLGPRAAHLVHIAAVAGEEGTLPLALASQEFAQVVTAAEVDLRTELCRATYADPGSPIPAGLRGTTDHLAVARIDALNLGCVPTSWAGVDPLLPRTFIRPLGDRIYAPDAQERLARAMRANDVITLDTGHNAARSAPEQLAGVVNQLVSRGPVSPLAPT